MTESRTVLFLCPHAAAKSVLAAAEFDRLAAERGLATRADAAGTEPDPATSPAVVAALAAEGVDVSGHQPRRVSQDELAAAWRVVSLGCDLDGIAPAGLAVERWDDVPPVSADLPTARAAIRARVARLVDELVAGAGGR
jgi:protein-tyrosine-phosphatase